MNESVQIGDRLNYWTVIGPRRGAEVLCRCACGRDFYVQIATPSKCCGPCARLVAGPGQPRRKSHPEYGTWRAIRERCYNPTRPEYKRYGGRGIIVAPEWNESFDKFFADMGPRPGPGWSIDRIDVNGNYEPGNCRWARRIDQQNNMRSNVRICYQGETLTVAQWVRRMGISRSVLMSRIRRGWSVEDAFTVAKLPRGKRKLWLPAGDSR